jgi:AMP-binding enzyme
VERSVSTGERTEADPLIASAGMPHRAMTMSILQLADEAGYRAALIDATDATVTAWPRFAWTVRAAAHGLGRRGLAEGDTAGVLVPDAASAAIAVNAIRAGGATACLIRPDASPADIAGRLNACGARLLITSASLAELAAEGADRSRVRQIIAFGEAAGTTPFSSLLESGRHGQPDQHEHGLQRNGSPARWPGSERELTYRDVVVAAPPCGDGSAYTSLLDLTLLTGATLVAAPLPLLTAAMRIYKGTAAIVPRGTYVPGVPPTRVFPVALSRTGQVNSDPGRPHDARSAGSCRMRALLPGAAAT